MEHIEKIVVGLLLFILTSVLAYLFKMRQLYVAAPKLFRHAPITKEGSLCELIVYNKGNQVEEQVLVELDPDLKAELLASSSSDITLSGSTLKVERLHKGCEASAMLLVEHGILDSSRIVLVSSKATKGTICKRIVDVPPNYARSFLVFLAIAGFVPGLIYGSQAFDRLYEKYVEYKLAAAYKSGWQGLVSYYDSDFRRSYGNQEFPVRLVGVQNDRVKEVGLKFEVYNKTALPLAVYADRKSRDKVGSPYFASVDVAPMSKATLLAPLAPPEPETKTQAVDFSFNNGSEFLYKITYTVAPN